MDADLNGSRYIGGQRLGAQVLMASPLGRGDGLSASVLSSTTGGLRFALLGYTTPIGADGIKGLLAQTSAARRSIRSGSRPSSRIASATATAFSLMAS